MTRLFEKSYWKGIRDRVCLTFMKGVNLGSETGFTLNVLKDFEHKNFPRPQSTVPLVRLSVLSISINIILTVLLCVCVFDLWNFSKFSSWRTVDTDRVPHETIEDSTSVSDEKFLSRNKYITKLKTKDFTKRYYNIRFSLINVLVYIVNQ